MYIQSTSSFNSSDFCYRAWQNLSRLQLVRNICAVNNCDKKLTQMLNYLLYPLPFSVSPLCKTWNSWCTSGRCLVYLCFMAILPQLCLSRLSSEAVLRIIAKAFSSFIKETCPLCSLLWHLAFIKTLKNCDIYKHIILTPMVVHQTDNYL